MATVTDSFGPPRRDRVTGWKEIAAYFDRGVRTVQRWEREMHLPVRRFGSKEYSPPWRPYRLFVVDTPGGKQVWGAWIDGTGQFPSIVKRLTPSGPATDEYWSAGFPASLAYAVVSGRPSLLLGGANNDTRGAYLAVFDLGAVRGAAPAETDDKACRTCGSGGPRLFLEFPPLDLMVATNGVPATVEARQDEHKGILVNVLHGAALPGDPAPAGASVFYWLDGDLRFLRADLSEQVAPLHRRLERAGLLDHSIDERDRVQMMKVRYWNGREYVPLGIGESPRPIPQ